jgi:hypothetical protein
MKIPVIGSAFLFLMAIKLVIKRYREHIKTKTTKKRSKFNKRKSLSSGRSCSKKYIKNKIIDRKIAKIKNKNANLLILSFFSVLIIVTIHKLALYY